jgi:excinuclease ABC subunit C
MVTFINGEADKNYYRHFRIRNKKGSSDTDSILEVAQRRISHFDNWGKPDLIIVDGGKGQVGAFLKSFVDFDIPIIGTAKRSETLVYKNKKGNFMQIKLPNDRSANLIIRLRNEAHRFARRYHHHLLMKSIKSLKK